MSSHHVEFDATVGEVSPPPNIAVIDGLPISLDLPEEVLKHMDHAITMREGGGCISITNTKSMYHGLRIAEHGNYIKRAAFSLCDGVGVIVAGLAWGYRVHRFNGPVLQLECARYGVSRGWRHFFYGGKEGVAEEMARRLKAQFPGLIVCGTHEPPFRELSEAEKADVARNQAAGPISSGSVGASQAGEVDLRISGPDPCALDDRRGRGLRLSRRHRSRAPPVLRSLGLEWLFRLVLQPRLRAKRYWWSLVYVCQATAKGLVTRLLPNGKPILPHGSQASR